MQLANSSTRYGAIPQAVHWLTAVFVAAGWLIGQFADFPSPKLPPDFWLLTHIALGQCVILLLVFRLAWRFIDPPPAFETTSLGPLLVWAARLSHFALYAIAGGTVARHCRRAETRRHLAAVRVLATAFAVAGRPDHWQEHPRCARDLGRRADDPCRPSRRCSAGSPLGLARSHAGAHAARRAVNAWQPGCLRQPVRRHRDADKVC
jgi:Prokaryotic cytochrome b561